MKKREEWLMEWDQVPTWVKMVFATILWLTVLAVMSLEIRIQQDPIFNRPPDPLRSAQTLEKGE